MIDTYEIDRMARSEPYREAELTVEVLKSPLGLANATRNVLYQAQNDGVGVSWVEQRGPWGSTLFLNVKLVGEARRLQLVLHELEAL